MEKSVYTSISVYKGKDKDICESIIPMRADSESDSFSIKCVLQNGFCSKVEKPYSNGKNAGEGPLILIMKAQKNV